MFSDYSIEFWKSMDVEGLEPPIFRMQSGRATTCATHPSKFYVFIWILNSRVLKDLFFLSSCSSVKTNKREYDLIDSIECNNYRIIIGELKENENCSILQKNIGFWKIKMCQ